MATFKDWDLRFTADSNDGRAVPQVLPPDPKALTVGELIARLKALDPALPVRCLMYYDMDQSEDDLETVEQCEGYVLLKC